METKEECKLNLPMMEIDRFFKVSECKNPKMHYVPWYSNCPRIESVVLNKEYFQMTLASKHDIMKDPTKEMVNKLKMGKFHFVVPCTIYKDLKRRRLVRVTESKKESEEFIINQMSKI